MRKKIREEFAAIIPLDDLEKLHLEESLAWIDSGVELCRLIKPAIPPRHLVAYFVLVDGDHLLLVDHKNAQRWLPPGGHVEKGEHPRSTATRELAEELGIAAGHDIEAPLMVSCTTTVGLTAGHIDVSLWYVVSADRHEALVFDDSEFNAIRWFSFDDIPLGRTDPHMERFLQKLKSHPVPASTA